MAEKAASNLSFLSTPHTNSRHTELSADAAFHQNRWASYSNLHGSFTQPPVELPSFSSEVSKLRVNTKASNEQPLLALFKTELEKISQVDCGPKATTGQTNNLCTESDATLPARDCSTNPTPTAVRSLKTLFDGLGDLASRVLEQSPEISRRLSTTGQELQGNLNSTLQAGNHSVQVLRRLVEDTLQADRFANAASQVKSPNEHSGLDAGKRSHEPTSTGYLTWHQGQEKDVHQVACCTTGCRSNVESCPVRRQVKELARSLLEESQDSTVNREREQHSQRNRQSVPSPGHLQETNLAPTEGRDRSSFEADRILAKRYISYNSTSGPTKKQYLIHWVGHGAEHDVWYDAENLGGCKGLIDQFEEASGPGKAEKPELSLEEVYLIHLRTAGDRMVASRRWEHFPSTNAATAIPIRAIPPTASASKCQDLEESRSFRHALVDDAHCKQMKKDSNPCGPLEQLPTAGRTSSVEGVQARADDSRADAQSTLRHRKSWHPTSDQKYSQRAASPTAAAERYPAMTSFEAAYAGPLTSKRRSLPSDGSLPSTSPDPARLQAGEHCRAWYEPSQQPYPKDKTVRFALTDPWMEKKRAQERWEAKCREEESLYGVDGLPLSKSEGKKPVRHSSPLPRSEDGFKLKGNGKLPERKTEADNHVPRRVKSLNLGIERNSHVWQRNSNKRQSPERIHVQSYSPTSPKETQIGESNADRHEAKLEPSLRRAKSARLASERKRQPSLHDLLHTAGNPSSSRAWPLPEPAGNHQDTTATRGKAGNAHFNNIPSMLQTTSDPAYDSLSLLDSALPPRENDSVASAKPDVWLSKRGSDAQAALQELDTDSTKRGSVHVQEAADASFRPTFAVPESPLLSPIEPTQIPPRTDSRQPRPYAIIPPTVRARGEEIRTTMNKLMDMGFDPSQASAVCDTVDGDLEAALDMLHEDRQARENGFEAEHKERKMPGAF